MNISKRYISNLVRFKKYLRISVRLLNNADHDESDTMSHIIAMDWRSKDLKKHFLICDRNIAESLSLSVNQYVGVLKAYGAFKIKDMDMHIFPDQDSCKKAIDCLYLIAYRRRKGRKKT
jgi:hypothetical protein